MVSDELRSAVHELTHGGECALAEFDVQCIAVGTVAHFRVAIVALGTVARRVAKPESTIEWTENVFDRLQSTGHMFTCTTNNHINHRLA